MQKQVEYAEAVKTKYPEQIVIAVAKDKSGKANPITLGWTMFASGNPPMMAIAVATGHYSVQALEHSQCFTIAYPSAEMAQATPTSSASKKRGSRRATTSSTSAGWSPPTSIRSPGSGSTRSPPATSWGRPSDVESFHGSVIPIFPP
jgi:flavin reductase (DIM6/NTAB) family NADH-FMN oxidoreductase RutF